MIIRINYCVFVCFYVCRNSCGYPRKNAYVCAAHQNSQDTVNCLEYEKATLIFVKNATVFSMFYVGSGSTVNADE